MATAPISTPVRHDHGDYVLLQGVRWSTYEALAQDLKGHRVKLTDDDGSLEIMTTSPRLKWRLLGAC